MTRMFIKGLVAASAAAWATLAPVSAATPAEIAAAKTWTRANLPGISDEVVEKAADEGEVMFYHLLTADIEKLFAAFNARYPFVKVKDFVASGGPLIERFRSESRANRAIADIVQDSSFVSAAGLAKDNFVMQWTPPNDDKFRAEWKVPGYVYPFGLFKVSVAWNPDVVTKEEQQRLSSLKTWDDFFARPWKSRIATVNVAAGGTTEIFYYYLWKKDGGKSLKALGDSRPIKLDSVVALGERIASGEAAIGVPVVDVGIMGQYLQGIPLQFVYPEPVLAGVYVQFISALAPHPNAAKLFQAWTLSPEGMAMWAQLKGFTPVVPGVPERRPVAKESWFKDSEAYYDVDPAAIRAAMAEVVKATRNTGN